MCKRICMYVENEKKPKLMQRYITTRKSNMLSIVALSD